MVAEVVEAEGAEEALPLPAVPVMHWKTAGHLGAGWALAGCQLCASCVPAGC